MASGGTFMAEELRSQPDMWETTLSFPVAEAAVPGDGERIEILFGGPGKNFERVNVEHAMDTQGLLRLGDWNSDGLTDLLIFDPQDPEQTVRIAINRGVVTPKKSQTPKTGPKARRP